MRDRAVERNRFWSVHVGKISMMQTRILLLTFRFPYTLVIAMSKNVFEHELLDLFNEPSVPVVFRAFGFAPCGERLMGEWTLL